MIHYDLFAGIGGFSLAADTVFGECEHVFVEIDPFCQAVLKKHWPKATHYSDITDFIADTEAKRLPKPRTTWSRGDGLTNQSIITGGFPCQPFSAAGRRRGTADDRYKWPEMFAAIQNIKPTWVIAENVSGLVNWNEGMVLEQVCSDLESEGYEVQPFIIPAVAVNAPHKRDRVWIIAHSVNGGQGRTESGGAREASSIPQVNRSQDSTTGKPERAGSNRGINGFAETRWDNSWQEIALATCHDRVDDGLPRWMDGATISPARHRKERLKAMGNAIVPQVAVEIMQSIKVVGKGQNN